MRISQKFFPTTKDQINDTALNIAGQTATSLAPRKKRNVKRDLWITVFITMTLFVFGGGVLYLRAVSNRGNTPFIQLKLDEGYGVTAYDATTNNNDGTLTGSTTTMWAGEDECQTGRCLYFDGSGDYVSVPDFDLD